MHDDCDDALGQAFQMMIDADEVSYPLSCLTELLISSGTFLVVETYTHHPNVFALVFACRTQA